MKVWFVGLQVVGIYGTAAAALVVTVGAWALFSVLFYILRWGNIAYPDMAWSLLTEVFGQPALAIAVLVAMVIASIYITRAALRHIAWAHWAAMALVAVTMLPALVIARFFSEPVTWVIALAYCCLCAAFIGVMTYVGAMYGPWGVTSSQEPGLPPTA
jgi:hypothetical protein